MKRKIELCNISLYESEIVVRYFHRRAQQGWLVSDMTSFFVVFKKQAPQDVYYKIDFVDRNNAFVSHKTKKILEYEAFLEEYGCTLLSGKGFRQLVQLPNKHFVFYSEEETANELRESCIKKEFRWILAIYSLLVAAFAFGFFRRVNTASLFDDNPLLTIVFGLCLGLGFWQFLYPYLTKKKAKKIKSYNFIGLAFLLVYFGGLSLMIGERNSLSTILFYIVISLVLIGLVVVLEKRKIITPIEESNVSKAIVIGVAILIGLLLWSGDGKGQDKQVQSSVSSLVLSLIQTK